MAQKVAQDDDDSENGKGKRVELTLSDLDDSSDEEDWRPFASQKRVAGCSRTNPREQAGQHAALTTPSPDPEQDSISPSSGPAWSWAVRPSRTRKAPERKLAPLTNKPPKKRKPFDPIGDLLKAQRRDEKQGKDIEAQRRAEGYDRDELLSEIHWDENDDLADENAAAQAARRGLKMRVGSETRSTDDGEDDGEDAEEVSEEMRIKLLGKDSGEAVGKIFANDRANKEDEEPVRGVNIWRVSVAGQESMDVDNILPEWINSPFDKEHPTLCILRDSALSGDVIAVMSMFQDLSHAHLADMPSAVHWLCELALSTRHDDLPRLAVQTLRDLDKSHKSNVPPLSSRFIKDVFTRLGLDIDASQELRRDAMHAFECLLCSLPEDVSQSHLASKVYSLFTCHWCSADSTDYNELGARVEVLSSALTDIPKYIAQEGLIRRGGALERARSTNVKGTTDQIYDRLMTMHGRISDTRAAHLDRSRAKDVIQRLAHRIHYDKAAAHGQKGRQSKLTDTIPRPRRVT
ncbi:hypothetical protein OF83DRAFT_1085328 [Amylostereum chailletii]|nr:hypothetical protein OF83DRAFT_1085328 [Amylostereum chailletii]